MWSLGVVIPHFITADIGAQLVGSSPESFLHGLDADGRLHVDHPDLAAGGCGTGHIGGASSTAADAKRSLTILST